MPSDRRPGHPPRTTEQRPSAASPGPRPPAENWSQAGAGARKTGHTATTGPRDGTELWTHPYQYSQDTAPVAASGRVYLTPDARVVALDGATGETVWEVAPGADDPSPQPPSAVVDGLVLVRRGATLYALDSRDGSVAWTHDLPGPELGLTVADGRLYVWTGTIERSVLLVLDPATGEQHRRFRPALTPQWGQFAVVDGTIYAGVRDAVGALDATDGTQKWVYDLPEHGNPESERDAVEFFGRAAVAAGRLHIADTAGRLHTLSTDGRELWRYAPDGRPGTGSVPAVADGVVYAGFFDDRVRAFDAETGEVTWTFWGWNVQRGAPAVTEELVYIGGWDEMVYALDRETGERRWEVSTPRRAGGAAVADGRLYVGRKGDSESGWVHALGPEGERR